MMFVWDKKSPIVQSVRAVDAFRLSGQHQTPATIRTAPPPTPSHATMMRAIFFAALASVEGFQTPRGSFDPLKLAKHDSSFLHRAPSVAAAGARAPAPASTPLVPAAAAVAAAALPEGAWAKGGEYGIAEGRLISLAHPVAMGGCFLATLYAGYTGLQWRRLRELGVELGVAKKAAKAAARAVDAATTEEVAAPATLVAAMSAADAEVASLQETRETIKSGNFRDVHYQMGTVLLAVGIPMALEGPVNTYMRAGKLFPGAHVYAGVAVASLWAVAAALVPEMQKGKDWARSGHIGANALTFALFAYYQIPTGLAITQKVIEKTRFPW